MEAMGHFIFELVKISILASVYACLILLLFRSFGKLEPNSWVNKISLNKKRFWIWCGRILSLGLFIFMFTYWGNHGLGDEARIPIGHFKVVNQIDGMYAFLENGKGDQLNISDFYFDKNFLYAKTDKESSEKGDYVVWDLKADKWKFYNTETDYLNASKLANYPNPEKFEKFLYYYNNYFNGLRFWLLP